MVNSANGSARTGAQPTGTGGPLPDSASEEAREPYSRIVVRPVGGPMPLGFAGLSVGTFVLAGLQLGWVPTAQSHAVALVLLAFVFPVQALASVLGFLCRDAVAATGMGVLAGTWLAMGAIMASGPPGATNKAAGLLLLLAGLTLLIPVTGGGADKLVASAVLATSSLRFFLTGAYHLSGGTAWDGRRKSIQPMAERARTAAADRAPRQQRRRRTNGRADATSGGCARGQAGSGACPRPSPGGLAPLRADGFTLGGGQPRGRSASTRAGARHCSATVRAGPGARHARRTRGRRCRWSGWARRRERSAESGWREGRKRRA